MGMQEQEAKGLVAYLVASFRPRDFGRTSEAVWVDGVVEFEAVDAGDAFRWIVREGFTRMPSIAEARAEIADRARQRTALERGLPEAAPESDAERTQRMADVRRFFGELREHLQASGKSPAAARVTRDPAPLLTIDEAEVARKRDAARAARTAIEAERPSPEREPEMAAAAAGSED
jgi:hypothetical protein